MEKKYIFLIAIFLVCCLLVFLIFYFFLGSSNTKTSKQLFDTASAKFADISNIKPNVPSGGLLGQSLGLSDVQPIIENGGETLLSYMTSCSPNMEKKSCSPWLFLRRDMNPMVFNFPGLGLDAPMMGILLDLEKMFPLVGTMAMIDADSNNGSCCCNAAGYFVLSYLPKDGQKTGLANGDVPTVVQKALKGNYNPAANYYIAGDRNMMNGTPAWIPGTAPTVCNACPNASIPATGADYLCQVNQAGAGINTWDMLLIWPDSQELETCFYAKGDAKYADINQPGANDKNVDLVLAQNLMATIGAKELPQGPMIEIAYPDKPKSCPKCNQPNLCVMQTPQNGAKSQVIPGFQADEGLITGALIGEDGMGYFDQYMGSLIYPETKDSGKGFAGKWLNLPNVAVRQCKFQRKDWDKWVEVQKQFYRNVLSMQDPRSSTFFKQDGSVHPYQQMYNANPTQGQYFEHEVNIYVDPDHTSAFYRKQQQRFQDSIIGFFYTCQTCEDSMEEIKDVITPTLISTNLDQANWNKNGSFNHPSDRCDGYFASAPNPGSRIAGDKRRAAEAQKQQQMRLSTLELCRVFREKYGRNIMPLQAKMHSNAFIGNAQTARSLEGKLQFSEIFQLIEPTPTDEKLQKSWQTAMQASRGSAPPPYTGTTLSTMVQASLAALVKIVSAEVAGPAVQISSMNSAKLRRNPKS